MKYLVDRSDQHPMLAKLPLEAAAVTLRIAFDPRTGRKVLTLRGAMPREAAACQVLCADIDGFSLHAAVRVEANDRKWLKQLCRCISRPPVSDERLQLNATGQVELKLKTPCRVGTTHLKMSPLEIMQRLVELVYQQRLHPPMTASRMSISAVGRPVWVGSASSWSSDAVVQQGSFADLCRAMVTSRERLLSLSPAYSAA